MHLHLKVLFKYKAEYIGFIKTHGTDIIKRKNATIHAQINLQCMFGTFANGYFLI